MHCVSKPSWTHSHMQLTEMCPKCSQPLGKVKHVPLLFPIHSCCKQRQSTPFNVFSRSGNYLHCVKCYVTVASWPPWGEGPRFAGRPGAPGPSLVCCECHHQETTGETELGMHIHWCESARFLCFLPILRKLNNSWTCSQVRTDFSPFDKPSHAFWWHCLIIQ